MLFGSTTKMGQSYLSNRSQFVEFNNFRSVPQKTPVGYLKAPFLVL